MNVQRSHGMDIDAYVKHLQSSKGHPVLTDNTANVDDEDDEEQLITTNTIQPNTARDDSSNRGDLPKGKQGLNDES